MGASGSRVFRFLYGSPIRAGGLQGVGVGFAYLEGQEV